MSTAAAPTTPDPRPTPAPPTRMLLVDGANIAMRCAFGGAVDPARAVQVATGMLARAVLQLRPTHAVIAFDPFWTDVPSWRRSLYADYKAHRTTDTAPYLAHASMEWERRHFFCVSAPGFEADDVIATVTHRVAERAEVMILSNDSDLLALASGFGKGVRVVRPGGGPSGEFEVMTAGDVAARYVIPHARLLPELKALAGEPGDNVPGVPGIGHKRAAELLCAYGSLDQILLAGSGDLTALEPIGHAKLIRYARAVYEHRTAVHLALRLVTLRADAPVPPIAPKRCALLQPEDT